MQTALRGQKRVVLPMEERRATPGLCQLGGRTELQCLRPSGAGSHVEVRGVFYFGTHCRAAVRPGSRPA
jgi:hypothetical protein